MSRVKFLIKILWNLPKTIWFNFHYLPFSQAAKLPILLFNVKIKNAGGKVRISSPNVRRGMVRLGEKMNSLYETNKGYFVWENRGEIIFGDKVIIGHNSAISTGLNGRIVFGDNFFATTSVRIVSYIGIEIGANTRIAWETLMIDTDFHETINTETGERSTASKEIKIGKNNWIGIRTVVLKGTQTPDFCITGAYSLLNKKQDVPQYSLLAGNPAKLIKTGLYRDLNSSVK